MSRTLFGLRALAKSRVKRVVILGLDGMDHGLTEKMLDEGKLPNLAALRDQGCFRPLGSTVPPISPVAWSTFQTGVNPGKHNIFDFLTPDLRTYHAKLSSVEIRPPRRSIRLGKYQIPLGKASVRLLRKSQPFWNVLSEYGIFSCILRVPITFPPEKLRGVLLSAMCVPDLRGTQGMFSHYTTRGRDEGEKIGGEVHHVTREGDTIRADLVGPENPFRSPNPRTSRLPFSVTIKGPDRAVLKIDGAKYELQAGRVHRLDPVRFRVAPGMKVNGLCKFLLLSTGPEFGLYVTPINIDPEHPAMPVGYPSVLLGLPGQEARAVRDARPGRRHVGAERARHQRRPVHRAVPRHGPRARGDVLRRDRQGPARAWSSASSTAPTASSTRSGATSTSATRPGPIRTCSTAATSSRTSTAAWTTSWARRWRSAETRTRC